LKYKAKLFPYQGSVILTICNWWA